ncbi:hypothetical protein L1276_004702 [Flavobacterium sp. HSC-32F16]|uniref:DUF5123 domain-containing protein n=1 Tax=Flavobacterium sp. HSC-32F16 TaxID=2910964 RepID=UPI0020A331C2|nr:DUF5123 domain-containing protein [Flavobacterium sp. HSC-32F16]MCP2029515.1 hypothetical protein [Flavobacterium sp. HSC-32F16]
MMKTKYIFRGIIAVLLLAIGASSCESYNEELLDSVGNTREFSPIGLKATVRSQTTVELNWTVKTDENADHYVVEFSPDDPEFKTIYKTVNVTPEELPIQVALEGETTYSIRVKAVSASGLEDSKWSITTATTLSEQIFFPIKPEEIEAGSVTLRWTPNSNVTQILVQPGNIAHTITPEEKTAGVAIVTGLTPETNYTATLKNGTKTRGILTFTSGVDLTKGIIINPQDDLIAKVAQAPSGSRLLLMPGVYSTTGEIVVNKTLIFRGVRPENKPKLTVKFTLANNPANAGEAVSLSLVDLDLNGKTLTGGAITIGSAQPAPLGDVLISSCYVHDFPSQLMYGNASARLKSFTVDNSIIKSVNTAGAADFIDFRTTYVESVTLTRSTFDNCSSRDFIRLDAASGFTGGTLVSNVVIDGCTIYTPTLVLASRILYVRFATNVLAVRNTLFAVGLAVYTNSAITNPPGFGNNNNFNSPNLKLTGNNNRPDAAATTLDPQFANAAAGDFTLGNQTLKDNKIGDPRWIK